MKKISEKDINKILRYDALIWDEEDNDYPNRQRIARYEYLLQQILDKYTETEQSELIQILNWYNLKYKSELIKKGWKIWK